MVIAFAGAGASCTAPSSPPQPPPSPTAKACGPGQTCHSGRCAVTVPPLAIAAAANVTVEEAPTPAGLDAEVLEPFVCRLTLPPGPVLAPVRLSVVAPGAPPTAMLFRQASPPAPHGVAVTSSVAGGVLVEALVTLGGTYGVTARPASWQTEVTFANDPLTSGDLAALVRNVSLQTISAAYWDGKRLYLGNGPRVLVYDGIPTSPDTKPAIVLGQPALDRIVPGTSASIFGAVNAIWSDGKRLVVAEGNRVLVWDSVPTASFTPADLVLGQQDFVSSAVNVGGVSASTLAGPRGLDSDGTRLVVADTMNHRVLAWDTFPTYVGQPATSVLGQGTFGAAAIGRFYQPSSVALDGPGAFVANTFAGVAHFASLAMNATPDFAPIDPSYPIRVRKDALMGASSMTRLPGGGLAMTDQWAARIGIQRSAPTSPTPFDYVLGQPDPNHSLRDVVSASTTSAPAKVVAANGLVLVPDVSRLLVFDHLPAYGFEPADRVVGQAGFSVNDRGTDYRRISERTLGHPAAVAAHGSLVAVADRGNNRVLLYPAGLPSTNAAAAVILGQPSASSFVPNVDQVSPSAATLSAPSGVALDGAHLIVADTENHRVLVWKPVPTVSGTPATFVLGQADFSGRRPNRGRGDADGDGFSDASADGMFQPTGVASDGTHLFVADRVNHRVLVWKDLATLSNGKPADAVLGQPDFTTVRANRGKGILVPSLDGLSLPTGLALDGSSLWIADTENNRLVRWDDVTTSPVASVVVGQPNGMSLTNPNTCPDSDANAGFPVTVQPTTAQSVVRPRSVAVAGALVFVSEPESNRVHVFEAAGNGYAHRGQLGQSGPETAIVNAGGIGAGSLATPLGIAALGGRLFVADSANHRVLAFEANAPSGAPAVSVIGQTSFVANGFNQALATSAGGATRPAGMAVSNGELLVAEASRHRVLVHELPLVPGRAPKRILGQPDLTVALPNTGGSPSAATLSSPRAVFADEARVVVADSANHRVLVYPRDGATAMLVLGQTSMADNAPNRGGSPGPGTLRSPQAVFTDGTRLVVADTGNHRVLVWSAFPTADGQPADVVIGQASFADVLVNRGTGVATATSLASPGALLVDGGALFIADTGNNRVLVYDALPVASGAAASRIVGQPDAASRAPTADIGDRGRLAGPVALASDGANLYVADRDANRIVAFALGDLATGSLAVAVLNANNGLIAAGPSGLAVERTPLFTSRLYVADTNKDQLLVLGGVSRLR